MIFRKYISNLLIGLLIPLFLKLRWISNVYDAVVYEKYKYYDFQINSLNEFLYNVIGKSYLFDYILGVILILFPFQIIKDRLIYKGKKISFLQKVLLLSGIVMFEILVVGSFSNIWQTPWWSNLVYFIFSLTFGLLFTTLLYFTLDRYIEKP
ncbi:hypothetical protein DSC47_10755 [Elizabethkingia miricola]|nr:hypothetical protein CQS02_09555 [Elizabethkingia miricola]OPC26369.1 hypothetical protein BAY00_03455 [Elizabethkingia bruuniana]OPC55033.1 hypothetical protein BAY07_19335 [Elizabethkingia bruuniana]OPC62549.1 hypothetical protein BAY13_06975 [Elizabethkingia bruuniana]RBI91762.1 hypothetical protein DSC47_10755 [Elizabethkingia miricola]